MAASAPLLPAHFTGLELMPNERLLSSFRPDVDEALRFSTGLVLLSDARLLVRESDQSFRGVPLTTSLELSRSEHAGLSELIVSERGQRVLRIRYTLALAASAHEFVRAFEDARGRPSDSDITPETEPEDEFALPSESEPVGHPLLRLLAFARPRFGKIAIGLALTLVHPLLVPWQEGHGAGLQSAYRAPWPYLGGLGLAAVVAWMLAWAQG